ncbi:TetR/AcrR family transcriptional regulator [Actinophytocola xanthii]|uniref:TetR family transcriptional regulator n=1 Tax=Actinophytocola xanthii TaxID=1912961 RepID=A0A1Q8CGR8_9PSEU|nr:TetR/AcrR family transcriptional regulator [Actinophytocola xanthii]OLF13523.1 TetR family transcriptional regulator [Actinophytocola xanthii]
MGRLSRVELRERNRARVLEAARAEFAERGFREAKVDLIAERAELTRGAVYSNFPGKRALYFAVLAEEVARAGPDPTSVAPGDTPAAALGVLARAWVARLPLATDERQARLTRDLLPEIMADERIRRPFAQLMRLNATLLGLALENLGRGGRLVRVAEAALTTLHGAAQLAAAAPGFLEPFTVVRACERLGELDLDDYWPQPTLFPRTELVDEPWAPPAMEDLVAGDPVDLSRDGVVAVLGLNRASAAEDAVRAAAPGEQVTVVLVTADPPELAPLARLAVADLMSCLRQAVPRPRWPGLRVVCDEPAAVAAAAGLEVVTDSTETALRVSSGRVVARATGVGAGHAMVSTATRRLED